jgi:hypothetical protein
MNKQILFKGISFPFFARLMIFHAIRPPEKLGEFWRLGPRPEF